MKKLSFILIAMFAAMAMQMSAAPGQPRFFRTGDSPEVSRTTSMSDDRSALQSLKTRTVGTQSKSFLASPAKPSLLGAQASKLPVAKSSQISPTLEIYGTVIYSDSWTQDEQPYGIYRLPIADGAVTDMQFSCMMNPLYSFYDGDHTVYTVTQVGYGSWIFGYDIYMYDTVTKAKSGLIEFDDIPMQATDAAYDPTSGKVYACFSGEYAGEQYRYWGYLDLDGKKVVKIADLDLSFRGVAIDKFGKAYAIDLEGNLYKVNKETAELELVGPTGCPALTYVSSAAYNDKNDNIILSFANDDEIGGGIVLIDPETGFAEPIAAFTDNSEVIGLYVPFQAPDKAPAAPEFAVKCENGSMTVDFTIIMPTTLYDGTDAAGQEMTYKIYADGTEILSGTSQAGAKVEVSKALTVSGNTNFIAVAANAEGESNQVKASCYVGKGTPAAAKGVKLEFADQTLTLTWEAVEESSDGGYLDAADVRYDVVDAEGNVVAEDLATTTWTKAQATPEEIVVFCYGVIAKYDGKTSAPAMSNALYAGHYLAPANFDMSKKDVFEQHTVFDANEDRKTWTFHSSRGTIYDYSTQNAADDWLFSPAIKLESGKAYDFEAFARAYSNGYPEKIEIKFGPAPTADAMTTTLVEETTLGGDPVSLTAGIAPEATGDYYIGFHAVSDKYMWNLYLLSYSISAPYGATAPDAVTDLKATPDVTGELKVALTFNAPAVSVTGAAYTGEMKLGIVRDDVEIAEITAAAGSAQTFNDNVDSIGTYTYTVISRNMADEEGRSASTSVFVGPNVPSTPVNVKAVENPQKNGELTLTWEQPESDVDGNALYAPNLTYNVYLYDSAEQTWKKLTEQPIAEYTYTFQAQDENAPQTFVQVGVQAINKGVEGEYLAGAGLVPVGPGYELPVAMSCFDDAKKYIIGLDAWDGCEFGLKQDGEMSSVTSQDGDGQFFYGERVRSSATLGMGKGIGDFIFGKVDLAGAAHPVFSLYTWKITEDDKTKLEIYVVCEGESKLVNTIDYADDTHNLWTKKVVNLEEYTGKAIQLIIRYYSDGLVYCFIDNMKFMDMPDYDLNAVEVTAPKTVTGGEPFEVTATIENVGRLAATNFDVELLANGTVVDTKKVESLEAGAKVSVVFEQTINMAMSKEVEYTAHIVYAADLDNTNDTTPKAVKVTREESTLPVVNNLTGIAGAGTNSLAWDAITADRLPFDPTVESFEDAEPFTKEYTGWTFIDRDEAPCGALGSIDIPNHASGDPESFIVIDGTYSNIANSSYAKEYRAATGKQYIGSIWCKGEGSGLVASDDWAISPELKGIAQTVTFAAKNASINYSEYLQVWYSTTNSVNPDDFEQIKSFNNTGHNFRVVRTDGWGNFSFELPEGALRFAFRVVSDDGMMLMIDDVNYVAADATVGLEHTGYNVYCDGAKLNDEPVTENSYVHTGVAAGTHTYHVTALYNRGESEVSEPLALSASTGIDNIAGEGASVAVDGHDIIVTAADDAPVQIVATDGKTIVATAGSTRATVSSGLYLVTIGQTVTKVVVR